MYLHMLDPHRLKRTLEDYECLGLDVAADHLSSPSFEELAALGIVGKTPMLFGPDALPDALVNDWLCSLNQPAGGSAATRRTYAYAIRQFLEFCQAVQQSLDQVRYETVVNYWRCRRLIPGTTQIQARTWNVHAAAICSLFDFAAHRGLAIGFRLPDVSDRTLRHFNREAKNPLKERAGPVAPKWITIDVYVKKVRPAALEGRFGTRDACFLDLLVSTGFRLNEGASQHVSEWPNAALYPSERRVIPYKLQRGCKGGRPREVLTPLHRRVVANVQRFIDGDRAELCHQAARKNPNYIEPNEIWVGADGNALTASSLGRITRDAFARAGVDGSAHTLRHTFSVYQLQTSARRFIRGAVSLKNEEAFRQAMYDPLRRLQKLLGHRWLETTMIYLDALPDIDTLTEDSLDDWVSVLEILK